MNHYDLWRENARKFLSSLFKMLRRKKDSGVIAVVLGKASSHTAWCCQSGPEEPTPVEQQEKRWELCLGGLRFHLSVSWKIKAYLIQTHTHTLLFVSFASTECGIIIIPSTWAPEATRQTHYFLFGGLRTRCSDARLGGFMGGRILYTAICISTFNSIPN